MNLKTEMEMQSNNIVVINKQMRNLEATDWRTAMKLLMDGKPIYKLEKHEGLFIIAVYSYRETEFGEDQHNRKITVREFERHIYFKNRADVQLSSNVMNILQFASQDWYKDIE